MRETVGNRSTDISNIVATVNYDILSLSIPFHLLKDIVQKTTKLLSLAFSGYHLILSCWLIFHCDVNMPHVLLNSAVYISYMHTFTAGKKLVHIVILLFQS